MDELDDPDGILTQRWAVAVANRGMGRFNYAVVTEEGEKLIMECKHVQGATDREVSLLAQDLAIYIVALHNNTI